MPVARKKRKEIAFVDSLAAENAGSLGRARVECSLMGRRGQRTI